MTEHFVAERLETLPGDLVINIAVHLFAVSSSSPLSGLVRLARTCKRFYSLLIESPKAATLWRAVGIMATGCDWKDAQIVLSDVFGFGVSTAERIGGSAEGIDVSLPAVNQIAKRFDEIHSMIHHMPVDDRLGLISLIRRAQITFFRPEDGRVDVSFGKTLRWSMVLKKTNEREFEFSSKIDNRADYAWYFCCGENIYRPPSNRSSWRINTTSIYDGFGPAIELSNLLGVNARPEYVVVVVHAMQVALLDPVVKGKSAPFSLDKIVFEDLLLPRARHVSHDLKWLNDDALLDSIARFFGSSSGQARDAMWGMI